MIEEVLVGSFFVVKAKLCGMLFLFIFVGDFGLRGIIEFLRA